MKKKKCGRFEFYDYQAEIKDIIYLAKDEFDCNLKDIKELDQLQQDLLHKLEEDINTINVLQIAWDLRRLRLKRRECKARDKFLYQFINELNNSYNKKTLNRMLDPKIMNYEEHEYRPRIGNKQKENEILA